ncbi:uncharacterized protein LOC111377761 [Olea europaea subsp. europaea]|uniref:Uncharacterized protein LOC111377761 n=1 Tax=Olea europaea subsp. europaea TaxID=158383 RepID=A0A8S0Q5T9_OLEEU|nr:uncharacterized protein LOC111377761 [Olea europaea subsp. europaea]
MDFLLKPLNEKRSDCPLSEQDIHKCPFLMNINKPTNFSFVFPDFSHPLSRNKGPIFEDCLNFDLAFRLFHGTDGVVPLSGKSQLCVDYFNAGAAPPFNALAASISSSAFGSGGPFGFHSFFKKMKKGKSESSRKKEHPKSDSSKHEALGNEWLETGNCPIAKSYRTVSHVHPLVASALQLPPAMKIKCPPAVVAARAALTRTAVVKTLRPQPLPKKMLVIGFLGIATNIPLGVWREHTKKFSLSWFVAVHAAVPFIAMLRKSVVMPKTAMALTIAGSIIGQIIGSSAERLRLKANAKSEKLVVPAEPTAAISVNNAVQVDGLPVGQHGNLGIPLDPTADKAEKPPSPPLSICL